MGQSKLSRRLIYSLLLMIFLSMFLLGWYLLHIFYQENLREQQQQLLRSGEIIQSLLDWNNDEDRIIIPERLENKLENMANEAHYRMTVIDLQGNVLNDTTEKLPLENHFSRKEVQDILQGNKSGTDIRHSSTLGYNMLYVALPIKDYQGKLIGVLRISESLEEVESTYNHLRNAVILALAVTLILMLVISVLLTHYQTKPIKRMTDEAGEILKGNLNKRLTVDSRDELAILGNTVNDLTGKLIQQIQETEALAHQQRLILANTDNIIMLVDGQANIVTANEVAGRDFGLKEQRNYNLISDLGLIKLADIIRQSIQSEERKRCLLNLQINGATKAFNIFVAPIREYDNQKVLCVLHDVSLMQKMALRQQEFVSNAAHELATPLTSIMGYAETIIDNNLCRDENGSRFLEVILREAKRMDNLLKTLLQLAHLENEDYRENIEISRFSAASVITRVKSLLSAKAEQKNQHLSFSLPEEQIYMKGNFELVVQAVYNILENAVKYTPNDGRIKVTVMHRAKKLIFKIEDNGIGMEEAALPLIFERFYRWDKHRSRATGGNGIGLSLAKFIVELFGGTVGVTSKLNEGSCFTVTFPAEEV